MRLLTLLTLLPLTLAASNGHKPYPTPIYNTTTQRYHLSPRQSYAHHALYTFTGSTLPTGLAIDTGEIADAPPAPYHHTFTSSNVYLSGGYLHLRVPGNQTSSPLTAGEISTTAHNILHGSVRTTAILTPVPGVCNGFFFYKTDAQEADIEFLSDAGSTSNPGDGSRPLHFTNQDADGDGEKTLTTVMAPGDATTAEHEYRLDWGEGWTGYYVDGGLVWETTGDVPSVPGSWVWNNWANGDPGWTGNPPAQDAVLKIKKIEMYYDTA